MMTAGERLSVRQDHLRLVPLAPLHSRSRLPGDPRPPSQSPAHASSYRVQALVLGLSHIVQADKSSRVREIATEVVDHQEGECNFSAKPSVPYSRSQSKR
jgi:hypothetical protein